MVGKTDSKKSLDFFTYLITPKEILKIRNVHCQPQNSSNVSLIYGMIIFPQLTPAKQIPTANDRR